MTTTITFHLVSTPDGEKAPNLDVQNVFTLSDDDAKRMLAAFIAKYTPNSRGGSLPLRGKANNITPPTADQAVTRAVGELWSSLKTQTDRFVADQVAKAALAQAPAAPEVKTQQATNVNVALAETPPAPAS